MKRLKNNNLSRNQLKYHTLKFGKQVYFYDIYNPAEAKKIILTSK